MLGRFEIGGVRCGGGVFAAQVAYLRRPHYTFDVLKVFFLRTSIRSLRTSEHLDLELYSADSTTITHKSHVYDNVQAEF